MGSRGSGFGAKSRILLQALTNPVAFGVSALALDPGGRALLVRHTYAPGWHLPGGGVHRGEPPGEAVLRELREEVGLAACGAPEFFGLYTRRSGFATNLIALYVVRDVRFDFRPNLEIAEIALADPAAPPDGIAEGSARRLAEFAEARAPDPLW